MAEIAAAPISVTQEARAVRAGGAMGGVPELAKSTLGRLFEAARTEVVQRIGLTRAEAQIKGAEQAKPKIGELGVKVIKGIGDLVEKRGDHLERSAYNRSVRAIGHRKELQALREKRVETERKAAEYKIANVTLGMYDLPGRVGSNKAEQAQELAQRVITEGRGRWHEFWMKKDDRVAERDLNTAVKYGEGAKATHDFADKVEAILGSKEKIFELRELKATLEGEVGETAAIKERLAGQFKEVLTTGADIGKGGAEQIKQQDITEVDEQRRILEETQKGVTATGIK